MTISQNICPIDGTKWANTPDAPTECPTCGHDLALGMEDPYPAPPEEDVAATRIAKAVQDHAPLFAGSAKAGSIGCTCGATEPGAWPADLRDWWPHFKEQLGIERPTVPVICDCGVSVDEHGGELDDCPGDVAQ